MFTHVVAESDREEFVTVFNQKIAQNEISGYMLEEGRIVAQIAKGALMPVSYFLPNGAAMPAGVTVLREALRFTIIPFPAI